VANAFGRRATGSVCGAAITEEPDRQAALQNRLPLAMIFA
jgi:hypothetical protein